MTQLVGALISVHNTLAFLTDLDSLPDPPCSPVRLTGNDCCLVAVDDVIFCVDVVCDSRFVLLCSDCDCLFVLLVYLRPSCCSTSFRCSFMRTPKLRPFLQYRPFGSFCMESCKHILLFPPC